MHFLHLFFFLYSKASFSVSKANKLRVRKIVNEIWDTSSSNVGLTLFEDLMELLKEIKVGIPNEEETRRQLKNALKGIY